jgi:guanylate kinase
MEEPFNARLQFGTIASMTSDPDFKLPRAEPLVIVISGPSGAGKDSVVQRMKERGLPFHFVVTATTREKRDEETEGEDYFFVSKEEFARMIDENKLLEYAIVYKDYKGIPRAQVEQALASGKDVVMRLDVQGADTVRKMAKDALLVFITAENGEELERRLRQRHTEKPAELTIRIATARGELKRAEDFDYVVINREDALDETVDIVEAIIEAEHHKAKPRKVDL